MPVKHWSFAGLLLTTWCNARCASCYLCCEPVRADRMPMPLALRTWRGLIAASPHGCRVHLSGGEPFGDWPGLLALCRAAAAEGLGPLESVETNAFWATDAAAVRERLRALDAAGMGKLVISADPFHQAYVPIARPRLLARVAEEVLGAGRVQVRWRDWLADGGDVAARDVGARRALFRRWAHGGRDRLNGRAAEELAPLLPGRPAEAWTGVSCREPLLRSRHVHVGPDGGVQPGVCAGILLGDASGEDVGTIWRRLEADHGDRPIVGTLARAGPAGLLPMAEAAGYRRRPGGYASRCHLCWEVRAHLVRAGLGGDEMGPKWMYATTVTRGQ